MRSHFGYGGFGDVGAFFGFVEFVLNLPVLPHVLIGGLLLFFGHSLVLFHLQCQFVDIILQTKTISLSALKFIYYLEKLIPSVLNFRARPSRENFDLKLSI